MNQASTPAFLHPEAIVSGEWLQARLENKSLDNTNLRIYECTTFLDPPPEGQAVSYLVRNAGPEFDSGHIPGASLLDLQAELSDSSQPAHLRFMMPAPDVLGKAFAAKGIGDNTHVVLYSRGSPAWATRIWWMLRSIGFDNAAILDGGFERWTLDQRPLEQVSHTYPAASLTINSRNDLFVGRDVMQTAITDPGSCTINALSAELHRGENARYGRPGRIPGSVNLPAAALVNETDKTFLSAAKTAQAFQRIGADAQNRILVYCGGGIAASLDAFLLYQLGFGKVAIYDASMSEWARDESLPIETG